MTAALLVVGAGRRVREDLLPALAATEGAVRLEGVFARRARTLSEAGLEVEPLDALTAHRLAQADMVYVAAAKPALAGVLERLAALGGCRTLLVETPVLPPGAAGRFGLLRRFGHALAAEDVLFLPWLETLQQAVSRGVMAAPRRVRFERSAWRYHAVPLAGAVLGRVLPRWGRRRRRGGATESLLAFASGGRALVVEPRSYEDGWIRIGEGADSVGDHPDAGGRHLLAPIVQDGRLQGFSLGPVRTEIATVESAVVGPVGADASVTALTPRLKRIALARLLLAALRGEGGVLSACAALDVSLFDELLSRARGAPVPFAAAGALRTAFSLGELVRRR